MGRPLRVLSDDEDVGGNTISESALHFSADSFGGGKGIDEASFIFRLCYIGVGQKSVGAAAKVIMVD